VYTLPLSQGRGFNADSRLCRQSRSLSRRDEQDEVEGQCEERAHHVMTRTGVTIALTYLITVITLFSSSPTLRRPYAEI
jgi:hypothetical protein